MRKLGLRKIDLLNLIYGGFVEVVLEGEIDEGSGSDMVAFSSDGLLIRDCIKFKAVKGS